MNATNKGNKLNAKDGIGATTEVSGYGAPRIEKIAGKSPRIGKIAGKRRHGVITPPLGRDAAAGAILGRVPRRKPRDKIAEIPGVTLAVTVTNTLTIEVKMAATVDLPHGTIVHRMEGGAPLRR